jgi:hypothetical protein
MKGHFFFFLLPSNFILSSEPFREKRRKPLLMNRNRATRGTKGHV